MSQPTPAPHQTGRADFPHPAFREHTSQSYRRHAHVRGSDQQPSRWGHVLTLDRRHTLRGVGKSWPHGGSSRWSHVLTLDIRRNLRGVGKSWPHGGASGRGQAELVKKSLVLMGRPLPPQERSRHGEAPKPPRLIPLGAATNPNGSRNGSRWVTFLPLKNQRPDPVRHSTSTPNPKG